MNVEDLRCIYGIYNILNVLNVKKIINNITYIHQKLKPLKNHTHTYKLFKKIDNSHCDIRQSIVSNIYKCYNIDKIKSQKLSKSLVHQQIKIFKKEYFFTKSINVNTNLYNVIINDMAQVAAMTKYCFIQQKNVPIGIKYIDDNDDQLTMHQMQFFGRKLELFLTESPDMMLREQERNTLFMMTSLFTFPTIYTVYEARYNIMKDNKSISHEEYLNKIVNYVTSKGYVVNIHRMNNTFVMSMNH